MVLRSFFTAPRPMFRRPGQTSEVALTFRSSPVSLCAPTAPSITLNKLFSNHRPSVTYNSKERKYHDATNFNILNHRNHGYAWPFCSNLSQISRYSRERGECNPADLCAIHQVLRRSKKRCPLGLFWETSVGWYSQLQRLASTDRV